MNLLPPRPWSEKANLYYLLFAIHTDPRLDEEAAEWVEAQVLKIREQSLARQALKGKPS